MQGKISKYGRISRNQKSAKERKLEKSLSNHSNSTLAKIGGGGLLSVRYDITAKQLSK